MSDAPSASRTPAQRMAPKRHRQLWWLIGVLAAVGVALVGWYVAQRRAAAESEALQLATLYTRVLEDQVSRALATTDSTLRALSRRGTLRRAVDDPEPAHRLLEEQLLSQSHLRSLSLLDDAGTVLVGTAESDVGRQVDLDALGRPADDARRARLSPLLPIRDLADLSGHGAPAGVAALALVTPVPMEDDRPPLWLVALVNPEHFVTRHMVLTEDSGVRALVADLQGGVIATTGEPLPPGATLAALAPFARFLPQREQASYIDLGSDGAAVVAAFRLSRQWPLVVLTEQPLAAVRAAWHQESSAAAALALLGLAGLLLLGLAADRSLRREQIALAEREALHDEVARTEARWKQALDAAGQCVWEFDLERRIFTGSARLNALLGGPMAEMRWTQDEWQAHIHPDDLPQALALFQQHLRGETPNYALEQRMRTAGGDWLWVNVGGAVTRRSPDGRRLLALAGTLSDISLRKATEAALRASEARQQAILASALDGIVTIDADGRLLDFNPAAERIFGHARADVIGRPMHELLVPHRHRGAHQAGMAHHRRTGEGPVLNRRIEIEALRASGEEFPIELAIVPVQVDAGTIFTATVRDISEPQRVQRALRASEERFRALFDHAAVGMVQQDSQRRVLRVNPAMCRMLGWPEEVLTNTPLRDLMHPEDFEDGGRDVARLFAGEIPSFTAERRYRHRDGHYIWGRITASATRDADGKLEHMVSVIEDVSARRHAEAELEQARQRELDVGARIQGSLLVQPPPQRQPGLWLTSFNQASQGVDGDFVEIVGLGDHGVDIVLGDVMGKGVAAALMGAATKMQFSRSMAELLLRADPGDPLPTPARIVASVHAAMARSLQSLEAFVTLSYVRLDTRTGRATWVGCGHEEPLLLRADGTITSLANQHPPLGVLDEVDYTQDETAFNVGDALFLASDGAADALLPDGSRFGRERIAGVLQRLGAAGQPPGALLQLLRAELARCRARVADDLTLAMAVRVDGRDGAERCELAGGFDDIAEVRHLVERHAVAAGLDEVSAGLFTLACVEAYTNAVRHTRGGVAGAPVEVLARVEPDALVVEIVNVGDRYSPPSDRTPTGLHDYPEGGFGLDIIARATDRVDYLHGAGVNTVRLTRWRDAPTQSGHDFPATDF
jgi:PAS domain S-box-containing protein